MAAKNTTQAAFDPVFDSSNFTKGDPIDNQYLTYTPGTVFTYNIYDADGIPIEARTVTVTDQTKVIAGVTCTVVVDVVTDAVTGQLIEVAEDYFAQDQVGNVWYFGESVKNYENGKFVDTEGSWIAGKQTEPGSGILAEPGIVMEASPRKGDTYDQENAPGVAEDFATVTSLKGTATLDQFGSLSNLLVTRDINPLEIDEATGRLAAQENKYYSTQFGTEVFAQTFELEGNKYVLAETVELVSVMPSNSQLVQAMAGFGATQSASNSPLTTVVPDEHGPLNVLTPPGHLT